MKAFFDEEPRAHFPWANSRTNKMPQTVWYKFSRAIKVGRFSFSSRERCCVKQSPLNFEFVASNDCETWNVLGTYETKFTVVKEQKSWTIPASSRNVYTCYGIKVLKVKSKHYAAIKHFNMWMHRMGSGTTK